MPAPLDPTVRDAIAAAIRDGAGRISCRGLAGEFDVSPNTVRKIAREIGLPDAFARAETKNATRARAVDMAERRGALATKMLDLAEHIAGRATAAYTVVIATKDEVFREILDEPPLGEVRQAMTAVGIAVDKHMALIRFDTKEGGNPAATSLVDRLAAMLALDGTAGDDYDDGYPADPPPAGPGGEPS